MGTTDILISGATVWKAPVGETPPDETSIAAGAAWGGNWENIGYTDAPLTVNVEKERVDAFIQQAVGPVKRRVSKEQWTLETSLAEFTMDNLALLAGGTVSQTAPGASQAGFDQLEAGGAFELGEYSVGFEGTYISAAGNEHPIRVIVHKANVELGGQLEVGKETQTGIPLRVEALEDLSKALGKRFIIAYKVTAPAT